MVEFDEMTEAQLRQWVDANPEYVNSRDRIGFAPLFVAVFMLKSLPLTLWLLDEKGADVNVTTFNGVTPLHRARTPDIVVALLDRGADPNQVDRRDWSPLMDQAHLATVETMARLLQDSRVQATINMQDFCDITALHHACRYWEREDAPPKARLLLQAGADATLTTMQGETPMAWLQRAYPTHHATIALAQEFEDAEKAALLVKARRFNVAANSTTVTPSYLQARVARGEPLPRVALMPLTVDQNDEDDEGGRKLRTTLAFLIGLGREGVPQEVFRVVMGLLMPAWDPLRRKGAGTGQPLPQR